MSDHPLPEPVTLSLDGENITVSTVQEAVTLLSTRWPEGARGPRRQDALDTCLKVLEGHRSAVDARVALLAAVEEAGMAAGG